MIHRRKDIEEERYYETKPERPFLADTYILL